MKPFIFLYLVFLPPHKLLTHIALYSSPSSGRTRRSTSVRQLFGGYYKFHRMLTVIGIDAMASTDHGTNRFKVMANERNVTIGAPNYEVRGWVGK